MLAHDFEQPPSAAPTAVLPLVIVARIRLPIGEHHAGFLRLVMNADDDGKPHAVRPFSLGLETHFFPHPRPPYACPKPTMHALASSPHVVNGASLNTFTRSMKCLRVRSVTGLPDAQV